MWIYRNFSSSVPLKINQQKKRNHLYSSLEFFKVRIGDGKGERRVLTLFKRHFSLCKNHLSWGAYLLMRERMRIILIWRIEISVMKKVEVQRKENIPQFRGMSTNTWTQTLSSPLSPTGAVFLPKLFLSGPVLFCVDIFYIVYIYKYPLAQIRLIMITHIIWLSRELY